MSGIIQEIVNNESQLIYGPYVSLWYIAKFLLMVTFVLVLVVLVPSACGISLGFFKIYKYLITLMFMCTDKSKKEFEIEDTNSTEELLTFDRRKYFEIDDICQFANAAAQAIIDDNVLKRFSAEELPQWNFMARSYMRHYNVGAPYVFLWFLGTMYRYLIQLPCRKQEYYAHLLNVIFCRLSTGSLGIFADFHDIHNLPTHGVVVSNHTSPIDVLVLGSLNFYRFTGQIQSGFFAYLQQRLSNMGHVFFDRCEMLDRNCVSDLLKSHCVDASLPPVIIFPEGTCINNTSVMQFRKGTFEVCDVVYPVAIKYNPMFGDPFWNSSKVSYGWYLIDIASSWFLYCDVWFLEPVEKLPGEDGKSFATRVQKAIAQKATIINLDWDGNLKRSFVPSYLKQNVCNQYGKSIKTDY